MLSGINAFTQEKVIAVQPESDTLSINSTKRLPVKKNTDNMPVVGNNFKQTYAYNNGKGLMFIRLLPIICPY